MFNKFKKNLKQNFNSAINSAVGKPKLFLIILIFSYIFIFSFLSLWKYYNFQYNAMDLAIINQVFYNSANGDFFVSSIHPPSYLGDHFSPILFLLLPLYYFYQEPQTLLIFQTVILALCAWPIFLIAGEKLNGGWALFLSFAWLANPFVHNINLFEFSFLPFAAFFVFWAFYFYQKEKFILFLIFCLMAMLAREDIALVVLMFCSLAFIQKRKTKWLTLPIILSIFYFFVSLSIVNFFAPQGNYKFLIYYSWLGATPLEILKNIFLKPWLVLLKLFSIKNIFFIFVLFIPFAFLNILSPTNLLLLLPIFLQFSLATSGASYILLQTHYCSLFLPALFISFIFSLQKIYIEKESKNNIVCFFKKHKQLLLLIVIASMFYSFFILGPALGFFQQFFASNDSSQIKKDFISIIPKKSSVAASYGILANLSSRPNIYSLNYIFLEKQQFLKKDYPMPSDIEYILFDYNDFISYQLQYESNSFYKKQFQIALNAWPNKLENFGLIQIKDNLALYQKNQKKSIKLIESYNKYPQIDNFLNTIISPEITLIGFNIIENGLDMFWNVKKSFDLYQIEFITDNEKKIYPFTYGITGLEGIIKTSYWPVFQKKIREDNTGLKIQLIKIEEGGIEINKIRGTNGVIDKQKLIGPEISLINP